ncbi:TPA_asm: phage major capsid protein [Listeria monocytogenes]|nr:phage major capsid protein [Listeria monocytogenes]
MNKIQELMEKRKQAWEGAKAFVEAKKDKDGLMSDEDAKTYANMEKKVSNFTKEIERMQSMEAMEREMAKPMSEPLTSQPMQTENNNMKPKKTGRASNEYKEGVLQALRSNFRQVSNVLQEGVDTAGGYLVPEEYDKRLIDGLTEENIMRTLGTTITTSGEHKINIAGAKPAASWIEEGGTLVFEDASFEQIILDAHKLHVAIKVTDELLYDNAFNLESYILTQFSKALANAEENAFLNGDGVGKPLGIFTENGGGQIAITTNTQSSITADEIINLVHSLKRPYRKNAKFIMNDQTIALIRKLKDNNGAYLWQPSLQAGEPDRLFGYPVYTSAYVPTVAAGTPVIAFGDFSYYNIGDRGVRSFDQLRELFAGNGMVGFLAKERVDGKLVLPEAIQILKMKASAAAS